MIFPALALASMVHPACAVDEKIGDVEIGSNLFPTPSKLRPPIAIGPLCVVKCSYELATVKSFGPLGRYKTAWQLDDRSMA